MQDLKLCPTVSVVLTLPLRYCIQLYLLQTPSSSMLIHVIRSLESRKQSIPNAGYTCTNTLYTANEIPASTFSVDKTNLDNVWFVFSSMEFNILTHCRY